jgi:hypothetical protein
MKILYINFDPLSVITGFGYKVRWRGLSIENATVYKDLARKPPTSVRG